MSADPYERGSEQATFEYRIEAQNVWFLKHLYKVQILQIHALNA